MQLGIFDTFWSLLLQKYDKKIGIKWDWQSLDSISIKSPSGDKTGHNPTDRSKLGSKRHILKDKNGMPLSTFITSANTHDVTFATNTIDNMVIEQQPSYNNHHTTTFIQQPSYNKSFEHKQNLPLDKAYHSKEIEQEIVKRGYASHTSHRREEEKKRNK